MRWVGEAAHRPRTLPLGPNSKEPSMDLIYAIVGCALIVAALFGWANMSSKRFTDADGDGAPDATPSERERARHDFENKN